jgi:type I restriction enzyme M protein
MFYTTDISVTLWILNKNQRERIVERGDLTRHYRNRENEILFMDLRQWGEPFEKKYVQFSDEHIQQIAGTLHTWQETRYETEYEDIPEYCYSASIDDVRAKDYSLVPSKYIEFINRDEQIDFDEKMEELRSKFGTLLKQEEQSKQDLLELFEKLGYEIEL